MLYFFNLTKMEREKVASKKLLNPSHLSIFRINVIEKNIIFDIYLLFKYRNQNYKFLNVIQGENTI